MSKFSLHNQFVEIPFQGMEFVHFSTCGGLWILWIVNLFMPPLNNYDFTPLTSSILRFPRRGSGNHFDLTGRSICIFHHDQPVKAKCVIESLYPFRENSLVAFPMPHSAMQGIPMPHLLIDGFDGVIPGAVFCGFSMLNGWLTVCFATALATSW